MNLSKFKFFSIFSVRDDIREIEKKDNEEKLNKNDENDEKIEEKLSLMGYFISQVDVSLTIPPKTSINIDVSHSKIDQEIKEDLLKTSGFFFKSIIYALDKAIDMQKNMTFKNKYLAVISIELSIIPSVKLTYKAKE